MTTTHELFDGETGELIGPATAEQVEASFDPKAEPTGAILIDDEGRVVHPGSWAEEHAATRKVFVRELVDDDRAPTTPTVGGFIEADLLRAACEVAANPRDEHRVALTCVALTLEGDRFQVQASDGYSIFWTGDMPSDAGHYLVDAANLAKALRANRAKGLLALSIAGDEIEVATVTLPEVKRFTLPLCPAAFPRLAGCLPAGDPQELTRIGLNNRTMAKVVAVTKAIGNDWGYGFTFRGPTKPVMVDFDGRPEAHMAVIAVRR